MDTTQTQQAVIARFLQQCEAALDRDRDAALARLLRQYDAAPDKRAFVVDLVGALLALADVNSLRSFVETQEAHGRNPGAR